MAKQFNFDDLPVVETKRGKLRGYQSEGTYIFKGIPYAKAQRFQQPVAVDPWEGVKEATSYGFVCPMLQQDNPQGELLVPHRYWPQNENCLNLNIWTQTLEKGAKKPVLVWIHGGAFSMGSSIEQKAYNGENMSKYGDVVVVSVNHRLNILGYLDLSQYGEKYADSANMGQEDLIAALSWVQENIEAFGGDKENVTVFGQSGGGMKISALLQMPKADGLFQKGIIMSGVAGDLMTYSTKDSTPLIQALLNELGLKEDEVLVIEGIHCLNDKLTNLVPAENKYKIYISDLTVLNIDYYNRISTTDTRLLRRIVRDNNFRNYSALHTLNMWYSVNRGEQRNIFPYQETADYMFNSSIIYEISVLKKYAGPLLNEIKPTEHEYSEARRLLALLQYFEEMDDSMIPNNSLIREFIGGSIFEE